jgi:hypothetical protein
MRTHTNQIVQPCVILLAAYCVERFPAREHPKSMINSLILCPSLFSFTSPSRHRSRCARSLAPQDDGIRLLQAQTHLENSAINLCHSSCSLQSSGLLTTYLTTLSTWLTANPNEIVTLLLTNPDSISPSTFAEGFTSTGLAELAYVPSQSTTARTEWPTLGEMVDSGKRLVVFMDYDADFSSVPYILDGGSPSPAWELR